MIEHRDPESFLNPAPEPELDREPEPEEPRGPQVLIVTERPSRPWARLLPPLVMALIGVSFLVYRTSAHDWRGLSWLFEGPPASQSRPDAPQPAPEPPNPPALARNIETPPNLESSPPDPQPPSQSAAPEPNLAEVPSPPRTEAPGTADEEPPRAVDPLADIERVAETTRERIATLEALKEQEARKLEETKDERRRADQRDRDLRKAAQRAQLRRQINEMRRWQMAELDEMRQRFLGDKGPAASVPLVRPRGFAPMPFPAMPRLDPGPMRPLNLQPGRERVIRTPDGRIARLRELRGPGGVVGFEMRWQSGREADADANLGDVGAKPPSPPRPRPRSFDDEVVPPPPKPAFRRFD